MTTVSNEIDEFSSLFDSYDNSSDSYGDELFEGLCTEASSSTETTPSSTPSITPSNTTKPSTPLFKIPSLANQNHSSSPTKIVDRLPVSTQDDLNVVPVPSQMFGCGGSNNKQVDLFPYMMSAFKFQPTFLPTGINEPLTFNQATKKRKSGGTQGAEERRLKNREAADKSRQKKKELLQTLPARNAELEARVQDLECGLAASKAEAAALREQCSFLKSLLSNKQSTAATNTGVGYGGAISPDYEASFVPQTTQGVLLLAVCCILTVNQWGLLMESYPENEVLHNGGRILLSIPETELEEEGFTTTTDYKVIALAWCLFAVVGCYGVYTLSKSVLKGFRSVTAWSPCLPHSNMCRVSLFKSHNQ